MDNAHFSAHSSSQSSSHLFTQSSTHLFTQSSTQPSIPILFTPVLDVDREIILHLSDKDLYNVLCLCKYSSSVCNETFWIFKFNQLFNVKLPDRVKLLDDVKLLDNPETSYVQSNYEPSKYKEAYKVCRDFKMTKIMFFAAKKGYVELLEKSLNGIDTINKGHIRGTFSHVSDYEVLFLAVVYGRIKILKYLFEKDQYIMWNNSHSGNWSYGSYSWNYRGNWKNDGWKCRRNLLLYLAAEFYVTKDVNRLEVINYLLQQNYEYNCEFILSILIKNLAKENQTNKKTRHSKIEIIKYLIKHFEDKITPKLYNLAVKTFSKVDIHELIKFIVEETKFNPNDITNETINKIVCNLNIDLLIYLVNHGLIAKNYNISITPFIIADRLDLIIYMLEQGFYFEEMMGSRNFRDIDSAGKEIIDPSRLQQHSTLDLSRCLKIAANHGKIEIVKYFGEKIDKLNLNNGFLIRIAERGYADVFFYLIKKGISLDGIINEVFIKAAVGSLIKEKEDIIHQTMQKQIRRRQNLEKDRVNWKMKKKITRDGIEKKLKLNPTSRNAKGRLEIVKYLLDTVNLYIQKFENSYIHQILFQVVQYKDNLEIVKILLEKWDGKDDSDLRYHELVMYAAEGIGEYIREYKENRNTQKNATTRY